MNEKDLKRQVILDIITDPFAISFLVAGFTSILFGWVIDSNVFVFGGISSSLIASGIWGTKALNYPDVINKSKEKLINKFAEEHEAQLNELYKNLKRDTDPRDEEAFFELREIFDSLKNNKEQYYDSVEYYTLVSTTEKIFDECVKQLKRSYVLSKQAVKPNGKIKDGMALRKEREKIIKEVVDTVKTLKKSVDRFTKKNASKSQLIELRESLERQLQVARDIDSVSNIAETTTEME